MPRDDLPSALPGARGGLSRHLTRRLRTGRPLRKRRRRADERRTRYVVPHLLIEHRPAIVTERSRVGDWEGDLVVGRMSRSAVATLVERRSRYLRLIHLPNGHTADQLVAALEAAMRVLPIEQRRTLTWDQGSEMARHDRIAPFFGEGVFFAYPASPWLRGSNENMNGLLRQYLPKGTDLSVHSQDDLDAIADQMNNRPRATHDWRSPIQVFAEILAAHTQRSTSTIQ